jgi:hypothetical protein
MSDDTIFTKVAGGVVQKEGEALAERGRARRT